MSLKAFIIGGAGFIGSHLTDALLARGDSVTVFDNLSSGRKEFLPGNGETIGHSAQSRAHNSLNLRLGILNDICSNGTGFSDNVDYMRGHDIVVHLSANPDARNGLTNTELDLHQGTIATYRALAACRMAGVPRFFFASSGTVYGPNYLRESFGEKDLGELPISLYGAAKLAGEAMCSAFYECFSLKTSILRFGNVIGPRATHGVIYDLLKQLHKDPTKLTVLGNGSARKPYLHVSDCVRGILHAIDRIDDSMSFASGIRNLAPRSTSSVEEIVEMILIETGLHGTVIPAYGTVSQGWKGDVAYSEMRNERMTAEGFKLLHTSQSAITRAVKEIHGEIFHK